MAITRAKATGLLNKSEMGLYDDSRANAVRRFGASDLGKRIERARKARDRARDLVQRQTLASRQRSGSKGGRGADNRRSKDKADLLTDIVVRLETALKRTGQGGTASSRAGKTSATRAAGKKTATRKASAKQAAPKRAGKKVAAKKAPGQPAKKTAKKTAKAGAQTTATKKTAGKRTAKRASAKQQTGKRGITPQKALANTRALLDAKHEQAAQPQPWQSPAGHAGRAPEAGYQSASASRRAEDLHAGESRLPAIQGSIGTRDRLNQGKRDHRGSSED